jgi:hypothetical protein
VEAGAWHDPEFMRAQEPLGLPVSFAERSTQNIELRLMTGR